jgi:oligopeptide/dipeptide ABC transporter ATP-binding protein
VSAGFRPLVQAEHLTRFFAQKPVLPFSRRPPPTRAVDDVSFAIRTGASFGLVGETGSGKTTIARLILRLERPTAGRILFDGRDLYKLAGADLRSHRRKVQAVLQDPWGSLNPRMRVRDIVAEPIVENEHLRREDLALRVEFLLDAVGLKPADAGRFPHEFSGGQRQRVAIARAIALHPALVVLDEPLTSLDMSVRGQIMNLLADLQEAWGTTYLLIAHDLMAVRLICHEVAVMYLGRIVELGATEQVFDKPRHPYTQALLDAARIEFADKRPVPPEAVVEESTESGSRAGCGFRARCPLAHARCSIEVPNVYQVDQEHAVACHLYAFGATT